jgi:hypothetical protein
MGGSVLLDDETLGPLLFFYPMFSTDCAQLLRLSTSVLNKALWTAGADG